MQFGHNSTENVYKQSTADNAHKKTTNMLCKRLSTITVDGMQRGWH